MALDGKPALGALVIDLRVGGDLAALHARGEFLDRSVDLLLAGRDSNAVHAAPMVNQRAPPRTCPSVNTSNTQASLNSFVFNSLQSAMSIYCGDVQ
jgi:hypothetical protein